MKMQEEEVKEVIKKQWFVQERQETRARLMRQKDKNIRAEVKAGIEKNYMPVGMSLAALNDSQDALTQDAAIRLSMTNASEERNQSPQAIFSEVVNLGTAEPSMEGMPNQSMH